MILIQGRDREHTLASKHPRCRFLRTIWKLLRYVTLKNKHKISREEDFAKKFNIVSNLNSLVSIGGVSTYFWEFDY